MINLTKLSNKTKVHFQNLKPYFLSVSVSGFVIKVTKVSNIKRYTFKLKLYFLPVSGFVINVRKISNIKRYMFKSKSLFSSCFWICNQCDKSQVWQSVFTHHTSIWKGFLELIFCTLTTYYYTLSELGGKNRKSLKSYLQNI